MRTKLLYFVMSLMAIVTLASCDKDSEGLTKITYYPTLTLEGDELVIVSKGGEFVEPGYTATMNGEDVSDQVTISSNLNVNKSGQYSMTYSIMNEDGINATATRTVVVVDRSDAYEGVYMVTPDSYRNYGGTISTYRASYPVIILNNGDDTYYCDDLLAGWYCQRAGYGTNYALVGNVTFSSEGIMSVLNSNLAGWASYGYVLEDFSGSYDSSSNAINMAVTYAGMTFYITMTKQ